MIEPWVRPAARTQATAAFVQIASSDGAALLAVRCADAGIATLVDARNRPLPLPLALPAAVTIAFAPGAARIVLANLGRTLRVGDRVPLVLVIRTADGATREIAVDAEVRRRSPTADHAHAHG